MKFKEDHEDYLRNNKVIRLGVINKPMLPFWSGSKDLPFGLQHDLSNLIAKELGIEIEYVQYDNALDVIDGVEKNEIDAAVGYFENKERREKFIFTKKIYEDKFVALSKYENLDHDSFIKLKWGCVKKSSSCDVLVENGYKNIVEMNDRKELYKKYNEDDVDIIIDMYGALFEYISNISQKVGKIYYDVDFGNFTSYIILNKDRTKLRDILNEFIKNSYDGKQSIIEKIYESSNYKKSTNLDFLLKSSITKVIRYSVEEDLFPLSYYDVSRGKYSGFIHDLMDRISYKTPLVFKYVPPRGRNLETMLANGEVDVIPSKNIRLVDKTRFINSEIYTNVQFSQIETTKDYTKKHVAVLDRMNMLSHDFISKDVELFTTTRQLMRAFQSSTVTNAYVNKYLVESMLIGDDTLFKLVPDSEINVSLVMIFRHEENNLKDIVDKVISSFSNNELENMWSPYKRMQFNWGFDKNRVITYSLLSILSFIFIIIMFCMIYKKMKSKVEYSKLILSTSESEKNWLYQLINSITSMICIFDESGNVVLSNKTFKDLMSKYNVDDSKSFIHHIIDDIEVTKECDEIIMVESSFMKGNHYHVINRTIFEKKGSRRNYLMILTDVSDQKNNEKILIDSNIKAYEHVEAQQQFVAVVSHELRTPISAMMGLMEILSRNIANEDEDVLSNAIKSAKRLNFLVDDILDYSKLDAKQVKISPDYHVIVNELCPLLRSFEASAELKGLVFDVNWKPTCMMNVFVDVMKLNQVVSNIVSNAIKFTEKGFISITIENDENELTVIVRDTGIGMSSEHVDKIFEPFVQADDSISRRYGGTGLGMSIVYNIVSLMEGDISVRSEVGLGSEICVRIPIKAKSLNLENNETIRVSKSDQNWMNEIGMSYVVDDTMSKTVYPDFILKKIYRDNDENSNFVNQLQCHVLVVEDDLINRFLIKKQLSSIGIDSSIVTNGKEALELLNEDNYDLVITDYHMPELNGFELAHAIRRNDHSTPIVICTADNSDHIQARAYEHGISEIMYKPYDLSKLHSVISDNIKSSKDNVNINLNSQVISQVDNHVSNEVMYDWLDNYSKEDQVEMLDVVIVAFQEFLVELDSDDVQMTAHRLKGAAGALNMLEIRELASKLENMPHDKELKLKLTETINETTRHCMLVLKGNCS